MQENSEILIRYTDLSDGRYLKQWLRDPANSRWFPMADEVETDDAVSRWIGFSRYKCSLTAVKNGVPCGICTLYLQPYKKLAHQCDMGIIVAKEYQGLGVGTLLLSNIMHLAKNTFHIELLHLQVYAGNPAIELYKKMGFREFGYQSHWIKEEGENGKRYAGRKFMERFL